MEKIRHFGTLIALAGKGWVAVSWLWEKRVSILDYLGPPEYVAAIILCVGTVVILNYEWMNGLRPAVRFRKLAPELESVAKRLIEKESTSYTDVADCIRQERLRYKLAELGVSLPDESSPEKVGALIACAWLGKLEEARRILPFRED
ncbi:MAG: hypothetical protein OXC65_08885 [Thiotrichales bacterium]|nr:hypothetical protein [Thiotrichales bacterium]